MGLVFFGDVVHHVQALDIDACLTTFLEDPAHTVLEAIIEAEAPAFLDSILEAQLMAKVPPFLVALEVTLLPT